VTLVSQNGWPVLQPNQIVSVKIPVKSGPARSFTVAPGNPGFVLAHLALWYHETVEPLNQGILDDWGYANRDIRGSTTDISNHASGTAVDFNATKHPLGVRGTLSFLIKRGDKRTVATQVLTHRLNKMYEKRIRGGFQYEGRPDEMHYEINIKPGFLQPLVSKLKKTKRGKRILKANPHLL
jgi:hypothetical protein